MIAGAAGWYLLGKDLFGSSKETKFITSSTPRGQKSLITLPDGSRVFLNSESSISYPEFFSKDKREISLTGEAFFDVTRDENRPCIIHSGNVVTKVLGTSFNIQAFDGKDILVTVATGKQTRSISVKIRSYWRQINRPCTITRTDLLLKKWIPNRSRRGKQTHFISLTRPYRMQLRSWSDGITSP
jgi:hypothetical protein